MLNTLNVSFILMFNYGNKFSGRHCEVEISEKFENVSFSLFVKKGPFGVNLS